MVTVGGLRSTELSGVGGIYLGEPARAARDLAIPSVGEDSLAKWATEQARLLYKTIAEPKARIEAAEFVRAFGGDTGDLPVAWNASGWLTVEDIATQEQPDEIVLVQDAAVHNAKHDYRVEEITLNPGVFVTAVGVPGILQNMLHHPWVDWPPTKRLSNGEPWFDGNTLRGLVVEALAEAWSSSLEDVMEASGPSLDGSKTEREIGVADGKIVKERVNVFKNPAKDS